MGGSVLSPFGACFSARSNAICGRDELRGYLGHCAHENLCGAMSWFTFLLQSSEQRRVYAPARVLAAALPIFSVKFEQPTLLSPVSWHARRPPHQRHGVSTPATQSDLCGICPGCRIVCQTVGGLYSAASGLRSSRSRKRFSSPDTVSRKPPYSS